MARARGKFSEEVKQEAVWLVTVRGVSGGAGGARSVDPCQSAADVDSDGHE